MPELQIRAYRRGDEDALVKLWTDCGLLRPWNDPLKDIERKLGVQPELFLVGELEGRLVASAMAGFEGHRGWVNYLAVSPDYQQQGIGRTLMQRVEQLLLELGCPKVNLQVRASNAQALGFYQQLGYLQDETVSLGKRLIPDQPG